MKDKEVNVITDNEGQKRRWKEYFEELLNKPAPQDTPDIPPADNDLPIDCTVVPQTKRKYVEPSHS